MTKDHRDIDRARVEALLEQYGADPERFPASERQAARALLASDAELSARQAHAAELDMLLNAFSPKPPSATLARKVAEIPLRHANNRVPTHTGFLASLGLGRDGLLRAGLLGAFALAAGIVGGIATVPSDGEGAWQPDLAAAGEDGSSSPDDTSWDEFAALAFADDLVWTELEDELEEGEQAL